MISALKKKTKQGKGLESEGGGQWEAEALVERKGGQEGLCGEDV